MKLNEIRIKLGPRTDSSQFMDSFLQVTQYNPIEAGTRILQDVVIDLQQSSDGIHISEIRALNPGQGSGTRALNTLVSIADDTQTVLTLNPEPIGGSGLDQQSLIKWYSAHGFVPQGNGLMRRTPRT